MKPFLILALMVSLPLMAANANSNTETDYRNNVQWAKDSISQNQQKSGFKDFDVNTLCQDAACRSGVANPAQSRYYNNESALSGDARNETSRNEQSQAVTTSFNNGRPSIDENDPAYRAAIGYQNDAYNISHGISSKYHDCDKGLRCEIGTATRSCSIPTNTPVQCSITPYVEDVFNYYTEYPYTLSGTPPFSISLNNPSATITSIHIQGELLAFGRKQVGGGSFNYTVGPATALHFKVNNSPLGVAPLQKEWISCAKTKCPYTINASFPYHGKADVFSLSVATELGGIPEPAILDLANLSIVVNVLQQRVDMSSRNSCGALIPECQQISRQCVESKETRIIDGVNVTQDCWKEQVSYQCNTPNTCTSLSECTTQSRACETLLEGVCISETQQRLCETQECQDVGLVCGEDSFALSGDYYEPSATQSTDFNRAAAGLAAISEAGQDVSGAASINENSAIIFKGDIMRCSNKPMGLSNCCQDSGWGNDIGITSCSEEEKALGDAKEDKLTISLGEYCAEKILGICIRKKKSYCAFSSKLARIVQEEGKAQLGLNFGSAKNPDCRAFTPNQLQQLNMDSMDFSDFYEDLHEGINMPNTDEIQQRLQQSVGGNS
ncbi:type-F conjugative transfer system mating-pair stabilization protein TraN [Shewanella benthica]|nr:type-F conjugative transfer system mating-pair stabilization protein TraN [Shewanella benthica]